VLCALPSLQPKGASHGDPEHLVSSDSSGFGLAGSRHRLLSLFQER